MKYEVQVGGVWHEVSYAKYLAWTGPKAATDPSEVERLLADKAKRDLLQKLRKQIAWYDFLMVDDETSNNSGLAVYDDRNGMIGTWIDNEQSLSDLITNGAEWWLESHHNISAQKQAV